MGWGEHLVVYWGVESYAPTPVLDRETLGEAGFPCSRGWDWTARVHAPTWLGVVVTRSCGGVHDRIDPNVPAAEAAAWAERHCPARVAAAAREWEAVRARLVKYGLPDPGPGALLCAVDYD